MADIEGMSNAINTLADDGHDAAAELQKLGDQVKSLNHVNVTPEQIDAITESLTRLARKLGGEPVDEPRADTRDDEPVATESAARTRATRR